MAEEIKIESKAVQSRRAFVKTAAQVAVTAPAAAMLLSASTKSASAQQSIYGDDTNFTSANDRGGFEDDKFFTPGSSDDGIN